MESYRALFETLGYNRMLILDAGLGDSEEFRRRTDVFASRFDFTIDREECNLNIFLRTYGRAKQR
jgi:hypothetical protein